jgi:hypothetical protein
MSAWRRSMPSTRKTTEHSRAACCSLLEAEAAEAAVAAAEAVVAEAVEAAVAEAVEAAALEAVEVAAAAAACHGVLAAGARSEHAPNFDSPQWLASLDGEQRTNKRGPAHHRAFSFSDIFGRPPPRRRLLHGITGENGPSTNTYSQ